MLPYNKTAAAAELAAAEAALGTCPMLQYNSTHTVAPAPAVPADALLMCAWLPVSLPEYISQQRLQDSSPALAAGLTLSGAWISSRTPTPPGQLPAAAAAALMCTSYTTPGVPTAMLQHLAAILQLRIAKEQQMTTRMSGDGE
jgi:hypothetical protein